VSERSGAGVLDDRAPPRFVVCLRGEGGSSLKCPPFVEIDLIAFGVGISDTTERAFPPNFRGYPRKL